MTPEDLKVSSNYMEKRKELGMSAAHKITARCYSITPRYEIYDKAGRLIEAIRKNLREKRNGG